jgi:hypothetical protein
MEGCSFEHFAGFIRRGSQIPQRKTITRETQFERDLGITGDDGACLLEAVERRFDIDLAEEDGGLRKTFHLGPNEFLFHSEGFELFPPELLARSTPRVRAFTVGELWDAVERALCAKACGAA